MPPCQDGLRQIDTLHLSFLVRCLKFQPMPPPMPPRQDRLRGIDTLHLSFLLRYLKLKGVIYTNKPDLSFFENTFDQYQLASVLALTA